MYLSSNWRHRMYLVIHSFDHSFMATSWILPSVPATKPGNLRRKLIIRSIHLLSKLLCCKHSTKKILRNKVKKSFWNQLYKEFQESYQCLQWETRTVLVTRIDLKNYHELAFKYHSNFNESHLTSWNQFTNLISEMNV